MYWTLELASKLEDAPWPATKDERGGGRSSSPASLFFCENTIYPDLLRL